ncbi:MAG: ECF transporter S component [Erysipelotrichaceae bacterium]|nr:ECF transporter S component [Erysipelotrichaceae bacterium]
MIISSLISALVIFASAALLKISIGALGYISLCDGFIVIMLSKQKPSVAMLIAAVSCVAADYLNGYSYYALATLIIKGMIGFLAASLKGKSEKYRFLTVFITLAGYGIYDWILYHSASYLKLSLCYNLLQSIISAVLIALHRYIVKKRG